MIDHRAALSTGTNRQRTETIVDLSDIKPDERIDTPPPSYEGLNLLPTYDDACKAWDSCGLSMVAENQSVGTTLTSQIRSTSGETFSNVIGPFVNGVPNSSTTPQYWVSPSYSSQPTVQDGRSSSNNAVSNSATANDCGQISEREGAQTVSKESVKDECSSRIMLCFSFIAFIAVIAFISLFFYLFFSFILHAFKKN